MLKAFIIPVRTTDGWDLLSEAEPLKVPCPIFATYYLDHLCFTLEGFLYKVREDDVIDSCLYRGL